MSGEVSLATSGNVAEFLHSTEIWRSIWFPLQQNKSLLEQKALKRSGKRKMKVSSLFVNYALSVPVMPQGAINSEISTEKPIADTLHS